MIDCKLAIGIVEDRSTDPLMLGRCKVRIFGLHTENKEELPTEDLPWAHPVMPANSASISGIGWSPTGILPGSTVLVTWLDEYQQQPLVLGTIGGIPLTLSAQKYVDKTNDPVFVDNDGVLNSESGYPGVEQEINQMAQELVDQVFGASDDGNEESPVETELQKLQMISVDKEKRIINPNNNEIIAIGYDKLDKGYSVYKLVNPSKWTETQQKFFMKSLPNDQSKYRQFIRPSTQQETTDQRILEFFENNFTGKSQ